MRLYNKKPIDAFNEEVFYICTGSSHHKVIGKNNELKEVIVLGKCDGSCGEKSYPLPENIFGKED